MKIIILGPAYPYRGGIADTNESFCRSLQKLGHEASLITFSLQYPSLFFPGKTQYSQDEPPSDIQIDRRINTINPINWRMTASWINRQKPDLVVVRYWIPFLAPCLGSITRMINSSVRKIAMCDNVIPHERRIGDEQFTRYFLGAFDAFITLSRSTFDELDEFSQKPKRYFPHPINDHLGDALSMSEARKSLDLDQDAQYLLFFGLVRKYKGLDLTLQALAQDRESQVKLLVIGEFYDDKQTYLDQIRQLGIQDRVIIRDEFIPSSEIKNYFCAADMMIQTYHTASQSGVTQIAYHFNCPMLVTDVGGLSEMVPHNKVGYVCQKNPVEIASAIEDFFKSNRRVEFVAHIEEEKKKFSWEEFSKALIQLSTQ
jgi:glycosyltransferase involved in cell wall biosynthesis